MRFLVDACTGPGVSRWLRENQHDVFSVYEDARAMTDEEIIHKAFAENWILITNDKDFEEKVFREKRPHRGIILMRLDDETPANKIEVIRRLLENYSNRLADQFVVVSESRVRFARAQ